MISPQLLAPVGIALDLKRPSLRFVPLARALSHLQGSKIPMSPLAVTQVCRNADSQFVNRQYLAAVTSAGAVRRRYMAESPHLAGRDQSGRMNSRYHLLREIDVGTDFEGQVLAAHVHHVQGRLLKRIVRKDGF
jgi:hypothetical protein